MSGWAGQRYKNIEETVPRCRAALWYWQKKFCQGYIDEDEDMYWIDRRWRSIVQNYCEELAGGQFIVFEEMLK